jgi:hypothetical protein
MSIYTVVTGFSTPTYVLALVLTVSAAIWSYCEIRRRWLALVRAAQSWTLGYGFETFEWGGNANLDHSEGAMAAARARDQATMMRIIRATNGRDGEYLAERGFGKIVPYDPWDADIKEIEGPGRYYRVRLRDGCAEIERLSEVLARHREAF